MTERDESIERKHLEAVPDTVPTPLPATKAEAKPVRRTATKEVTWKAWAGPIKDLHLINARFQKQAEARRAELLRDAEDDYERHRVERDFKPTVTLRLEGQEVTGTFEQVVEELDPRTWEALVWNCGGDFGSEWVRVQAVNFNHLGSLGDVIRVKVKSADPGFVASTVASLSEAIDLSKPGWGWLHAIRGRAFVSIAAAVGASGAAFLILRYFSVETPNRVWSWIIAVMWTFNFGIGTHLLLPKVMPPIEIRYDTVAKSKGSEFVGWVVGVLLLPFVVSLIFWLLPPRP